MVAGVDSPWARRRKIALSDLVDEPWCATPIESSIGSLLAEAFVAKGLRAPWLVVSGVLSPYVVARLLASSARCSPKIALRVTTLVGDSVVRQDGTIALGKRADVNVIDLDRLRIGKPVLVPDLPGGSDRYLQSAVGYVATFVHGQKILAHDRLTGARPGRLVRGT